VDVSEHDDELGGEPPEPKPERKKRSDAGKPRSPSSGGVKIKPPTQRFQRRAEKAQNMLSELLALGKPDLDVEGLSFLEVVDRDVVAWGRFFAQLGEWLVPFGTAIDLFFGSPLVVLLNMAPSVRAARRDLAMRSERRAVERQLAAEEQEAREVIEREHEQARQTGVFAALLPEPEPEPAEGPSREEWLAAGGAGE
jgi:hypothetical protein